MEESRSRVLHVRVGDDKTFTLYTLGGKEMSSFTKLFILQGDLHTVPLWNVGH